VNHLPNPTVKTLLGKLFLIPNLLTLLRILLIFPALYLLSEKLWWEAGITIMILFLTDFFDGYTARRFQQISDFGSIFDPIADKIVVLSFFGYFWNLDFVPVWYFIFLYLRNISQLLAIPVLLLWKRIPFQVKPKLIPKWGTTLQFILLGFYCFQLIFQSINGDFPWAWAEFPILFASFIIEIYILITFVPRFIEIYLGKHDTFE